MKKKSTDQQFELADDCPDHVREVARQMCELADKLLVLKNSEPWNMQAKNNLVTVTTWLATIGTSMLIKYHTLTQKR